MKSLIVKVTSMRKLTTPVSYVFYALLYIIGIKHGIILCQKLV